MYMNILITGTMALKKTEAATETGKQTEAVVATGKQTKAVVATGKRTEVVIDLTGIFHTNISHKCISHLFFRDRKEGGGFGQRDGGGFGRDRNDGGGFRDRKEGGGFRNRNEGGGFRDRNEGGGFRNRNEGGFGGRERKPPIDSWDSTSVEVKQVADPAPPGAQFATMELAEQCLRVSISWFHNPSSFYCQLTDNKVCDSPKAILFYINVFMPVNYSVL